MRDDRFYPDEEDWEPRRRRDSDRSRQRSGDRQDPKRQNSGRGQSSGTRRYSDDRRSAGERRYSEDRRSTQNSRYTDDRRYSGERRSAESSRYTQDRRYAEDRPYARDRQDPRSSQYSSPATSSRSSQSSGGRQQAGGQLRIEKRRRLEERRRRRQLRRRRVMMTRALMAILLIVIVILIIVAIHTSHSKKDSGRNSDAQRTETDVNEASAKQPEDSAKQPEDSADSKEDASKTADTTAPEITGTKDITITEGDPISYKSGVTVTDDTDPDPKLSIDNSAVKLDTPGTYEVIYKAEDASGNVSTVTIKVTIEEKTPEDADTAKLHEQADAVLAEIVTDDMDQIHKCYAIWHWVRTHVPWYGGSVDNDPVDQALKGLAGNPGDCYTDTVTYQVLLERAGFETIFMQRSPGIGYHYWVMVKIGDNWYHSDPAPIYKDQFVCFLGTDAQLKWFSEEMRPNYYTHDTEGIPTTPDEPGATVTYKDKVYTLVEE